MNGMERKRRRIKQEEEEAFTTLWIYLEPRLSFFFSFRTGFGLPPGILARQAFVGFGKGKQAKELGKSMFSSQQLYSPTTRRDEPALVLYSRSFVSKKVNIHFHPYLMLPTCCHEYPSARSLMLCNDHAFCPLHPFKVKSLTMDLKNGPRHSSSSYPVIPQSHSLPQNKSYVG
jgi:hypothetical protein